jgi:hypothetical protein
MILYKINLITLLTHLVGKDVERSGHVPILGSILAFDRGD